MSFNDGQLWSSKGLIVVLFLVAERAEIYRVTANPRENPTNRPEISVNPFRSEGSGAKGEPRSSRRTGIPAWEFSPIFHSISGLLYLQACAGGSGLGREGRFALLFGYSFNIEGNL